MVLPVNVDLEMKEIEQYLQESPASGECDAGVNENGLLQSCTFGSLCPNTKMGGHNDYPYFYCAQEYHHELRLRKRRLAHREALLEFYWSSQGKSDSHQFLKESGLITQYR
ncbi:unnamed protein product [Aspergillus oryzae]|uniref:Unnamed protein product n=1 Tax=Aspergillus oryzae TaxID=5062 RepID=A0AAN4Z1Q7_ASPOZ|nr:unnamed protein product [Aspergillus oryzae]